MEETTIEAAGKAYRTVCEWLNTKPCPYEKNEDQWDIRFQIDSKPIPMQMIFYIDRQRQLIRLISYFPFVMSEAKRMDAVVATCVANRSLVDGNFDCDMATGRVSFRMCTSYGNGTFGTDLPEYMFANAYRAVRTYNAQFLALEQNRLSLDGFIEHFS